MPSGPRRGLRRNGYGLAKVTARSAVPPPDTHAETGTLDGFFARRRNGYGPRTARLYARARVVAAETGTQMDGQTRGSRRRNGYGFGAVARRPRGSIRLSDAETSTQTAVATPLRIDPYASARFRHGVRIRGGRETRQPSAGPTLPQKQVRSGHIGSRFRTQKQVRSCRPMGGQATRRSWYAAETGTPRGGAPSSASGAETGTLRPASSLRRGICAPYGSLFPHVPASRPPEAQKWVRPEHRSPVDKPVQCGSYPRRKRFGPCAETGSRIRRFGFEASQNRVRCTAESGTDRVGLRLRFNGLGDAYTVYE